MFTTSGSRAFAIVLLVGASVARADEPANEPANEASNEPSIEVFVYPSSNISELLPALYLLLSNFFPDETILAVANPSADESSDEPLQATWVVGSENDWISDLNRFLAVAESGREHVAPPLTDRPRLVVGVPPQFDVRDTDVRLTAANTATLDGMSRLCTVGSELVQDRIHGTCRAGRTRVGPAADRWDVMLVPAARSLEPGDGPGRAVFFEPRYGLVRSFDASAGPRLREGVPITLVVEVDEDFVLAARENITELMLRGAAVEWTRGRSDREYRATTSLEVGEQTLQVGGRVRGEFRVGAVLPFDVYELVAHVVDAGDGEAFVGGVMRTVPFWAKRSISERQDRLRHETWEVRPAPWKTGFAFGLALLIGYLVSLRRRRRPLGILVPGAKSYREASTGRVVQTEGPIAAIDPAFGRARAVVKDGVLWGDFIACDVDGTVQAMRSLVLGSSEVAIWDHGCAYRVVDASRFDVDAEPRVALITNAEAEHFSTNPVRPFPVWFQLFVSQFVGAAIVVSFFELGVTVLGSLVVATGLLSSFAVASVMWRQPPVWESGSLLSRRSRRGDPS